MKKILFLILLGMFLVSCSSSGNAISETQTTSAPKTLEQILESYGYRQAVMSGCNGVAYQSAPAVGGMTTICVYSVGTFSIYPPMDVDALIPMIREIFGSAVANWVSSNKTPKDTSGFFIYNVGSAGGYRIEIDFEHNSPHDIELIEIK